MPVDKIHDGEEDHIVYLDSVTVVLASESEGRSGFRIFFTRDGSQPTAKSERYREPVVVTEPGVHTFTVVAYGNMMADSEFVEASFTVMNRVLAPVFEPSSGLFKELVHVRVKCETPKSTIYWTLDGSEPQIGVPPTRVYSGDVVLDRRSEENFQRGGYLEAYSTADGRPIQALARAVARAPGMVDSEASGGCFSILEVVKTPQLGPAAGMYSEYVVVTMTCETPDAQILYVVGDGPGPSRDARGEPGEGTKVYSGPVRVEEVGWTPFRCRAVKNGMWESEEMSQRCISLNSKPHRSVWPMVYRCERARRCPRGALPCEPDHKL